MKILTVDVTGTLSYRDDLQHIVDQFTGCVQAVPLLPNLLPDLVWLQEQGNYCFLTTPPASPQHSAREVFSRLGDVWGMGGLSVQVLHVQSVQMLHDAIQNSNKEPVIVIYQMLLRRDGSPYFLTAVISGDNLLRKFFIDRHFAEES